MKITTILGTRPEIIRLSIIMQKLDKLCDHKIIHTDQNYSPDLKDIFFKDLNLRQPDYYLSADTSNIGQQLAIIFKKTYDILKIISPDKILILGDTNSGLASIIAEKMQIPVYHMEAGNRCYDPLVPEEKNRKIIDAVSTYNLPYTPRSRENLLREGFPAQRIMASGNPINEVLIKNKTKIDRSNILKELKLSKNKFFVVTAHRAENVDNKLRLKNIFLGLNLIANKYKIPIICSIHPRTKEKIKKFRIRPKSKLIKLSSPFNFFDFVKLEKNAICAISDSGTVQEECCIFNVPTVTIRRTTERPETVDCGSNILSDLDKNKIFEATNFMLQKNNHWEYPIGYLDKNVSDKVINFLLTNKENLL
ncbi:UDP-N-acetylglucosamine 2-epimerase (non-hydrolyzing) [Patescibacteria group bacterium]|nr:UDP-N-acetylglucosamine 2-epimerase (non-hydrolyzing) [Patescibacteria group bacterium]